MINKLSVKLADRLLSKGTIEEQDKDIYIYGMFMLLSYTFYFSITILLGVLFSCVLESIVHFLTFQFIRKFAGGYHANTETRCEIMSIASITLCISIIKLSKTFDFQIALIIITAIAAVCILIFSPLESPEKPLTNEERIHFRTVSHIVLCCISLGIILSKVFKIEIILVPSCLSLILESILLIAGKIKGAFQKQKC
jgi:accessory gene regulator B